MGKHFKWLLFSNKATAYHTAAKQKNPTQSSDVAFHSSLSSPFLRSTPTATTNLLRRVYTNKCLPFDVPSCSFILSQYFSIFSFRGAYKNKRDVVVGLPAIEASPSSCFSSCCLRVCACVCCCRCCHSIGQARKEPELLADRSFKSGASTTDAGSRGTRGKTMGWGRRDKRHQKRTSRRVD